jgi:hypothetical protein
MIDFFLKKINSTLILINNKKFFFFTLAFLLVMITVMRFFVIISFSPDIVVGEDNNVWNIQKMLTGLPLYTNPELPPYEIFQYSPISQYFTFWICKILNIIPSKDTHSIFIIGRILSLIFNLITSYYIYVLIKKFFNANSWIACIVSIYCFIDLTPLDYTLRTDSFYNLISILAIYQFVKFIEYNQLKNLIISMFFFSTSFFAKQSGIQFYFFIPLYLLLCKNYKNLFYTLIYLTIFSLMYLSLFYILYGNNFINSLVKGIANRIDLIAAYHIWNTYFFKHFPFILIGFFAIFKWNFLQNISTSKSFLGTLSIYLLLFSIITSLKVGSSTNYYTLFNYMIFTLIGIYASELTTKYGDKNLFLIINLFIIIIPTNLVIDRYFTKHSAHFDKKNQKEFLKDSKFASRVKMIIKDKNQLIFTPNKNLKNFFPNQTIFPNTEYYAESIFNYENFTKDKSKLTYIILNNNDDKNMNVRTIDFFKIDLKKYDTILHCDSRILLKYK